LEPARVGNRGTPLLVRRRGSIGFNPRLARVEMTSPSVLSCITAISRAALRTSSSIDKVVRIPTPSASNTCLQIIRFFGWSQDCRNFKCRRESRRGAGPWGRQQARQRQAAIHGLDDPIWLGRRLVWIRRANLYRDMRESFPA